MAHFKSCNHGAALIGSSSPQTKGQKMKIIEQSHEILSVPDGLLQTIERAGRTCYKSEDRITPASAEKFVKMLINRGHHAMIEFGSIIVKFVTNRGVTHELVRHRLCSFAQESTRYVNYSRYAMSAIEFIKPVWWPDLPTGEYITQEDVFNLSSPMCYWVASMMEAERAYGTLIQHEMRPEQAREVLPNSLKTEIVVQANIREWRHIFKLRAAPQAHPQMQALIYPLLTELRGMLPVVFDDI